VNPFETRRIGPSRNCSVGAAQWLESSEASVTVVHEPTTGKVLKNGQVFPVFFFSPDYCSANPFPGLPSRRRRPVARDPGLSACTFNWRGGPPRRKVGLRSLWRTAGADTRQTFGFHHVGRCLEPRLLLKKSIAGHCRLTELRRSCKKNWPSCRFSLCPSDYRLNEQRAKIPPLPPNKRRAMKYNGDLICRSFAI
jgi:hypothetical protein